MWLVRIHSGVEYPAVRVDDCETYLVGTRKRRRPRLARAWKTRHGASAISQSPEGAAMAARNVLEQPEPGPRGRLKFEELAEVVRQEIVRGTA